MPLVNGTAGSDNINGDLLAGDLNDIIYGGNGNDRLRGLFGNDRLFGEAGDDRLEGGDGDDWLDGGIGQDRLEGGSGADHLTGGAGNDTIDGGDGVDRVYYSGPWSGYQITGSGGITVRDLVPGNGNDGTDTVRGAERLIFTDRIVFLVPNVAPVTVADAYATDEDMALVVAAPGLLANDSDLESDPLTALLVSGPAHGSLALNPDGGFVYTPATNFNGTDSFSYRASDGFDPGNVVTVILTVNAVNDAPVATPDAYTLDEDTVLTIAAAGVLANDSDVDGDPLTASLVTGPAHGTLVFSSDGSFTYTPDANFAGTDSFTYIVNDGTVGGNTVMVTLNVNPVNDAPVAVPDSYELDEDTVLTIAVPGVLANDLDVDGDPLIISGLASGPAHGFLIAFADGSFSYTPDANFHGTDSFSYVVNDGTVDGNTVTVILTVNAVNDVPVATPDAYTLDEDTVLTIAAAGVLANDGDVDGDPLTASLVTGPAHGTLAFSSDGSFTYTPDANFAGTDSFTYTVSDGTDGGNTVMVTLNVEAVNDAPVAVPDFYELDEDEVLVIAAPGVLANDLDVDGDPLIISGLASGPAHGFLIAFADGNFSYAPDADFHGADSFSYVVSDGTVDGNTVTVILTVNAVNDVPVATPDAYELDEDMVLTISAAGVLANDSDVDGDPLSSWITDGPAHGILAFSSDGSFTYTPDPNFHDTDSFTYTVSDGTVDGNTVTVTLTVNPVNDAPVATADSYTLDEDTVITIAAPGLLANDSDADGDPLLISALASGPAHGGLIVFSEGSFSYTPNPDFFGTDSFSYVVNDGTTDGNTVTVTFTVNPINDAPAIDAGGTDASGAVTELPSGDPGANATTLYADGTIRFVDEDDGDKDHDVSVTPDGPDYLGVLSLGPGKGTISWSFEVEDSALDFLLDGETRTQTYTVTIEDGDGGSVTQQITILITGAADAQPPVVAAVIADQHSDEDEPWTFTVPAATFYDGDGDPLVWSAKLADGSNLPAWLTFTSATQTFSGTPPANFSGSFALEVSVTDGTGTASDVFTLTIDPVNDAPVVTQTLPTQSGRANLFFSLTFPAGLMVDDDGGQPITWSATLADGSPLPAWLSFDAGIRNFSGEPGPGDVNAYSIRITGTEPDGTFSTTTFALAIVDGGDITGTENGETIAGTIQGDIIAALGGNDIVNAGPGVDLVYGDSGTDQLNGEQGNDILEGGLNNDTLRGGDGNDQLFGQEDNDNLQGGIGNDQLLGGAGSDFLQGESGSDLLDGGDGNDSLFDNDGANTFFGGAGQDDITAYINNGAQTIDAGADNDTIRTYFRAQVSTITTGTGSDTIELHAVNSGSIAIIVTDFTPGAGGDVVRLVSTSNPTASMLSLLTGWDGNSNPFGPAGFLRLIQSGADTWLQWDQNGAVGGASWQTLVNFQNTNVAAFTAANFAPAYPPDGTDPPGQPITGTNAGETLNGTIGGDTIDALGGNDTVNAGPGADFVYGRDGSDTLNGEAGNDFIEGGLNNDSLQGGDGDDQLFGEADNDTLNGGGGNDALAGGDGTDNLAGGNGNDELYGGIGNDNLQGEDGNDLLDGGDGNDFLRDWGGINSFVGGAGLDLIFSDSSAGAQTIDAGADNDTIQIFNRAFAHMVTTGSGSDIVDLFNPSAGGAAIIVTDFTTGAGGDVMRLYDGNSPQSSLLGNLTGWDGSANPFGPAGFLQLVQSGADTWLQWDQNGATGGATWQTLVVFQNTNVAAFTAANFAPGFDPAGSAPVGQTITGNGSGETLNGTPGGDTIDALGGNDTVFAGPGVDLVDGGDGADQLFGEAGNDIIEGGLNNDFVRAGDGADQVFGQADNDTLYGEAGNDQIDGGDGDDQLLGGDGIDLLNGGIGNDSLQGEVGNDQLTGGDGNDFLRDWDGANSFSGGIGQDEIVADSSNGLQTIDAGADNDTVRTYYRFFANSITTGTGSDTLDLMFLNSGTSAIVVTDFTPGAGGDAMSLTSTYNPGAALLSLLSGWDGASNPFGAGLLRLVQSGADTLFQWDQNGATGGSTWQTLVVFQNTNAVAFTDANFRVGTIGGYDPDGGGIFGAPSTGDGGPDNLTGTIGDDVITGLGGNDNLFGGNGNDTLDGGADLDLLNGGFGSDVLTGGAGNDLFVFDFPSQGADHVTDFASGADDLVVTAAAFGGGLVAGGGVTLQSGATPAAVGGGGQFLYDTDDGRLFWDADGTGSGLAILLVTLDGAPALAAGDFVVV